MKLWNFKFCYRLFDYVSNFSLKITTLQTVDHYFRFQIKAYLQYWVFWFVVEWVTWVRKVEWDSSSIRENEKNGSSQEVDVEMYGFLDDEITIPAEKAAEPT